MARPDLSFSKNTEPFEFMTTARGLVVDYVAQNHESQIQIEDVSIIWFTTHDQEWRVLLGTTLTDGVYYRVAHNDVETRLDVYKKFYSHIISTKDKV